MLDWKVIHRALVLGVAQRKVAGPASSRSMQQFASLFPCCGVIQSSTAPGSRPHCTSWRRRRGCRRNVVSLGRGLAGEALRGRACARPEHLIRKHLIGGVSAFSNSFRVRQPHPSPTKRESALAGAVLFRAGAALSGTERSGSSACQYQRTQCCGPARRTWQTLT